MVKKVGFLSQCQTQLKYGYYI